MEQIVKDMECTICFEIFREPITTQCGHSYCRSCIAEWNQKNDTCPACRSFIVNLNAIRINTIIDKISELFRPAAAIVVVVVPAAAAAAAAAAADADADAAAVVVVAAVVAADEAETNAATAAAASSITTSAATFSSFCASSINTSAAVISSFCASSINTSAAVISSFCASSITTSNAIISFVTKKISSLKKTSLVVLSKKRLSFIHYLLIFIHY
jgi:hypothetical protein